MKRYEHVIILGIDGGGHFFKEADTPNFDRIFANGAVTYTALTSFPSISAECWTSLATGVSPRLHGCTNSVLDHEIYPADSLYPTFFRRLRENMPDAVLGAYCDWSPLVRGMVEPGTNVDTYSDHDEQMLPYLCQYVTEKKPNFLFIQFDSVDHAGHGNGYGTPAHLQQIHVVDGYLGQLWAAVEEAGMADSTLFMLVCDHGGTCYERTDGQPGCKGGHGGWTYNERNITFAARGKGVLQGNPGEMNIRDLAAIVLYAFDIQAPEFDINGWTGQLPAHLFEGETPDRQDISNEESAPPRISAEQHATALL